MEVNVAKRIENKNYCVMFFGYKVKNHWVEFDLDKSDSQFCGFLKIF